jgi:hypothetical protein
MDEMDVCGPMDRESVLFVGTFAGLPILIVGIMCLVKWYIS